MNYTKTNLIEDLKLLKNQLKTLETYMDKMIDNAKKRCETERQKAA